LITHSFHNDGLSVETDTYDNKDQFSIRKRGFDGEEYEIVLTFDEIIRLNRYRIMVEQDREGTD
jgi:hypothetical protein